MKPEASEQYNKALKAGQKYYKNAVAHGGYPYPLVLDEILDESSVAGYMDLGLVNIPTERIVGTRSAGRTAALAGNFMPLLEARSEFAGKWISLCDAHLSEQGIRDPIQCYEYLGRFYVQEGNKRLSVLLSYQSPTISGRVTRIVPRYSDDHDVQIYYEFMRFYSLSGLYGVDFRHRGCYDKLQAALGFDPDHVWTDMERRSFSAGFSHFRAAFEKLNPDPGPITPAEALLVWLQVFPFSKIKEQTQPELTKSLAGIWPDVQAQADSEPIALSTAPEDKEKSVLSKLREFALGEHIDIAFIYSYSPETSPWIRAHDEGRQYLEERMGDRVSVSVVHAYNHDYLSAILDAIEAGAKLIFAATPSMIDDCRKAAALHPEVHILNCALSQPYPGVRVYYNRIYECKFIAGAIAGIMTEGDTVGYVANYPIFGVPTGINAFALGLRMTRPGARVKLLWSCTPGDPVARLSESGVTVISNRDIAVPNCRRPALGVGTYILRDGQQILPLVTPVYHWGKLYEKIVESIFSGAFDDIASSKAVNYWWGMDSGVLDVQLSEALPEGPKNLGRILRDGIADGSIRPFQARIVDQAGQLRNDGSRSFSPEELMNMDWFCDNVDGQIPGFEELLPMSRDLVRVLGLYRRKLPPEKEEKQL